MLVSIPGRSLSLIAAAALMSACSESTGTGVPNVAGVYHWREHVAAITCTPQRPPAEGGTVIFDAFVSEFDVRIQQSGSQITIIDTAFPNDPGPTGSIDAAGKISVVLVVDFQEEPRGTRTFFDNLTIKNDLTVQSSSTRIVGSGSYVNVFREGSATAPVFATCSRTSTIELTKTGT